MKRKAVVRLLAGTLCTATMAGSILPDTSVAYAKENPVGTVETATQEETSDTDKKPEAETPENTAYFWKHPVENTAWNLVLTGSQSCLLFRKWSISRL